MPTNHLNMKVRTFKVSVLFVEMSTWQNNGSAPHHQSSLCTLEEAWDDESLIGATGDNANVKTHDTVAT